MRQPRARRPVVGVYRVGLSRRAWSPLDLKPAAWFRSDLGITLNASAVSAWADQSGTGNAAMLQGTGSAQPTFAPNAINGLPGLTFDGTADNMAAAVSGIGNFATAIVVLQRVAATANGTGWLSLNDGAANDGLQAGAFTIFENSSGGVINLFRNSVAGPTFTHPGNGVPFVLVTQYDGTNNTGSLNCVSGSPAASSGSFSTATSFLIGSRFPAVATFANVTIAEVVFLKRPLSDQEIRAFGAYARTRYGIAGVAA